MDLILHHHLQSNPPSESTHQFQRLYHFWNAPWKCLFVRVFSTVCVSLNFLNCIKSLPLQLDFQLGEEQEVGAQPGQYSGWGTTAILKTPSGTLCPVELVRTEVSEDVLSPSSGVLRLIGFHCSITVETILLSHRTERYYCLLGCFHGGIN
jgi:hypothetical protein